MSGTGTQADPWDLATALASPLIKPGHTLHLAGGIYNGDFTSTLAGSESNPITIKPDAPAVIDGALTINGQDTVWQGIEVMYSGWTTRETEEAGSSPADLPIAKTVDIFGPRTKFINCVLRDLSQGCGFWTPAVDAELSGCIIFNNGWIGPDRNHGHGAYTQNATGTKRIRGCVFGVGYSPWGIHAYTQGGGIQGFDILGNVHLPNTLLVGGFTPVDRLTITGNHIRQNVGLGYDTGTDNLGATVTDNYIGGSVGEYGTWADLTVSGNVDPDNTNAVYVLPNAHDALRALVVIYNAALAGSVDVDLTALNLTNGDYRLRNAANYMNEWHAFTYSGAAVSVPMTGWTVATPIGASAPLADSTAPGFMCFVLEPV